MEVENKYMMSKMVTSRAAEDEEEDDVALPGFRFHPTDEELVGFYLRRKVEKRPINIELIRHIDIYKYEPWDLPKPSSMGEKEWYFFCKRGRKYRNSIRPNRVTGSGFWKATGIDKPIYSSAARHECIGLKKSLVYYRGSAGKGTKTDWMMHEFRLPAQNDKSTKHIQAANTIIPQEAEVWTVCRIFKRNSTYKNKWVPTEWRIGAKPKAIVDDTITSSANSDYIISFGAPAAIVKHNSTEITKPFISGRVYQDSTNNHQQCTAQQIPSSDMNELLNYWDELRSILELDPY